MSSGLTIVFRLTFTVKVLYFCIIDLKDKDSSIGARFSEIFWVLQISKTGKTLQSTKIN